MISKTNRKLERERRHIRVRRKTAWYKENKEYKGAGLNNGGYKVS